MSEVQQKNTGRAKLPLISKIAVWWLLVFGSIGIITAIVAIFGVGQGSDSFFDSLLGSLNILLPSIFYLLSALFLIRGDRGWTVFILLIEIGWMFWWIIDYNCEFLWSSLRTIGYYSLIVLLVPLILIIIDWKNFNQKNNILPKESD